MTMKKVLFLTAPRPSANNTPLHLGDNRPPQGIGYVAAYLEKYGHKTKIVDLYHFGGEETEGNPGVNQEETFHRLKIDLDFEIQSFEPDYIGMYIHTLSYYKALKLGSELKKKYPEIVLMCGGPHSTVLEETIPDYFDYVVVGEGEYVTRGIVEGRERNRIVIGVRPEKMDELPWPNYDWFIDKPYNWKLRLFGYDVLEPVISLNTTRGCPFPCQFCGVRAISGTGYRSISPEIIIDKLIEYKNKYSLKGIYFREDNFTTDNNRLERFCDLMIKREVGLKWACESRVKNLTPSLIKKMYKAGCCGLYIGVESGSPRMLEYMRKNETVEDFLEKFPILHDNGIKTYTTWIYGLPEETQKDRRFSDELLEKLNPTSYDKFVYIGIPKSDFYCQLDENSEFEYKELNGIIYPKGYLSLAQQLYGEDDPRCKYVERVYKDNDVSPVSIVL
ncbi:MAG: oxidoreductase [Candidatus Scalindua rubra]|uniref:Oxidoreductase n=1 Tax=Candidatus Scalindua rubra TaxID=1872076 RepID=A0A1E3XDN9_9BACT|nr:MAG: oxidoreductase [Candidatus Scalindua rubra]